MVYRQKSTTPKFFDFKVTRIEREEAIWKVYVDLSATNSGALDESLEGAAAW
jgi:hypothetical protein